MKASRMRAGAAAMPRRRAGFTLIELLVVVAIIATLVAFLTPALSRAGEMTHLAVCGSNLKDLGRATQLYMSDHSGQYPAYSVLGTAYDPKTLQCPTDREPSYIPANVLPGATASVPLSYGLNSEYTLYNVRMFNTPKPGMKALLYDGMFGDSDADAYASAGGGANPPGSGKITIIHFPPGNPANANPISISHNAAPAHMAHGDIVGFMPPGAYSLTAFLQFNFNPRHQLVDPVGNILYADFHVANSKTLDNSMLLFAPAGP